jgi:signal transduction histidine kinase
MDLCLHPGGDDMISRCAYAFVVGGEPHRTMSQVVRPLPVAVAAIVVVVAFRSHPRPGLAGEHLGLLVALVAFVLGVAGVMWGQSEPPGRQLPFFAALVVSSSALVALQPNGAAFLGTFVAVAAAALSLRGRQGTVVVVLALVALAVAELVGKDRSLLDGVLRELGAIAFYVVARLAGRLAEGQEEAERLLLELEQSRDAQARAAVLAERQRLAREMHDVLAHSLSGLALQLEGARLRAARHEDPGLVEALERARHLARGGIEEARRAIGMLRDDELPGPERLPRLVADFERDTGIPTTITVDGDAQLFDPDARLTLFRTAQEALTNVRKHARAVRVELRLAYEPTGARLTVEDFGTATKASDNGAGYGLTGMRERAELLGGKLTATRTDEGFRVELWVPA